VTIRLVIIGGGPGGNTAATWAARLGAEVTIIERDIMGGAAHLLDCIPSKAMIATGGAVSATKRFAGMGLEQHVAEIDVDNLAERIDGIRARLENTTTQLLDSQGIRIIRGDASFIDAHTVLVRTTAGEERIEGDAFIIATGSRPRIPQWCTPDGERILTTRDCYPPKIFPTNVCIVGSGVTGVEFVHMFESFGAKVSLVVSRQQVLPGKDPEVAAVLEDDFLRRGVRLLKGARAESIEREGDEVVMVGTPYRLHEDENGQPDGRRLEKTIHLRQRDFMLYEWRFNLVTGKTHERVIDDVLNTEFPVINSLYQGRKNRYSYNIIFPLGGKEEPRFPGLVKYDLSTGGYLAYSAGPKYFYNEPGFAPRDNAQSEDDGYLVVPVWNPDEQRSEIQVFDCKGARIAEGPVARILLPRRMPHGFHATFVSQSTLNRWK